MDAPRLSAPGDLTECLPCAKHWPRYWATSGTKANRSPASQAIWLERAWLALHKHGSLHRQRRGWGKDCELEESWGRPPCLVLSDSCLSLIPGACEPFLPGLPASSSVLLFILQASQALGPFFNYIYTHSRWLISCRPGTLKITSVCKVPKFIVSTGSCLCTADFPISLLLGISKEITWGPQRTRPCPPSQSAPVLSLHGTGPHPHPPAAHTTAHRNHLGVILVS